MKFRKLRIAFSAFCGLACVLLIALWVRSYGRADQIYGQTSARKVWHFGSMRGQVTLRRIKNYNGTGIPHNWLPENEAVSDILKRRQRNFPNGQDDLLIYRFNSRTGYGLLRDGFYVPHWFLAAVFGILAIVSWRKPGSRFSLRTLLIGVTFVALALGLLGLALQHH